jgi:hypothetical protein
VAAIAWLLLFVLLATFPRQLTTPDFVLDNPIGVLKHDTVELLAGVWIVGLLALVVACSAGLFVRYRRANSTEREQIKWLLYACALFLVVFIGGTVSGLAGVNSVGGYIWGVFFGLSLMTLPAAIGIAILRYRLYDIDLIINRTLVYGLLTGDAGSRLPRRRGRPAVALARRNRPGVHPRYRGFYPAYRRLVQPPKTSHPGFYRQALLP